MFETTIFEKPSNESIIKITMSEFRGSVYTHIREYKMDGDTGYLFPTKSGYAFLAEEIDSVIEGLQLASEIYAIYVRENSNQLELDLEDSIA